MATDFKNFFKTAASIAEKNVPGTVINVSKMGLDYTFPVCDDWYGNSLHYF